MEDQSQRVQKAKHPDKAEMELFIHVLISIDRFKKRDHRKDIVRISSEN